MPRVRRKIDKDATHEAWCELAGSDPPQHASLDGRAIPGRPPRSPDASPLLRDGRLGSAHTWPTELGTTEAPKPKPDPKCDIKLTVEPRPLGSVVEATKDIRVMLGNPGISLAGALPGRLITYPKGTRFKADAELVAWLSADYFREV